VRPVDGLRIDDMDGRQEAGIMRGLARQYRPVASVVVATPVFASAFASLLLGVFHDPLPRDILVGLVSPDPIVAEVRDGLSSAPTD
jgi:hypothetical protein